MSRSYVSRYETGQREEVWNELRALGAAVHEPRVIEDATAVAAATMRRSARNVDLICERLLDSGYQFDSSTFEHRERPDPSDGDLIRRVESQLPGPIPLSLRACMLEVGWVWLCGSHPDWYPPTFAFEDGPSDPFGTYADPLVLPDGPWLYDELQEWEHGEHVGQPLRPFTFLVFPNEVHKAGFSGSGVSVDLPDASADPMLDGVVHRPGIYLVDYLRASFAWGGFPGYEFTWAPPPPLVEVLKSDLVPI